MLLPSPPSMKLGSPIKNDKNRNTKGRVRDADSLQRLKNKSQKSGGSGAILSTAQAKSAHPSLIRTLDGVSAMRADIELDELRAEAHADEDREHTATDSLLRTTSGGTPSPHPLFPPLPTYEAQQFPQTLIWGTIRYVSTVFSFLFLTLVVIGAGVTRLWGCLADGYRHRHAQGHPPDSRMTRRQQRRPFHFEEWQREAARRHAERKWERRQSMKMDLIEEEEEEEEGPDECPPLEGGKDPVICDVAYYARRVGLDVETVKVQTEDGFVVTLWHVYHPQEYVSASSAAASAAFASNRRRYPVLLMPGLMQSAGAYCSNDDDSLAFFLCKSGYDVWLGNNRCGLGAEHVSWTTSDPRMWAWNIQQLGVRDLAALLSRVLDETGFEKLGLVCHSQGTAQTLVALAKEQRPELGERISVFCALAPAAYAGPMLDRIYFRFLQRVPNVLFRLVFGIHAFIPFMVTVHRLVPSRIYGTLGYHVFSFLFQWTDARWDRGLRDRMFQFAPVYVSSETMRWWLGPDGFAQQKCILSTHQESRSETEEDHRIARGIHDARLRRDTAWYGPQMPPVALWVAGSDNLVDGERLLQRFRTGREPHVRLVHAKVVPEYEHLDVLWAMDVIEQVGREIRQVLWSTMPDAARSVCRTPRGCE